MGPERCCPYAHSLSHPVTGWRRYGELGIPSLERGTRRPKEAALSSLDTFRRMFSDVTLQIEDLFLLEHFQIGYLPGWAPEPELAAVLHAYPAVARYLTKRNPAVSDYVERILGTHGPAQDARELERAAETLLWTIADLLVYQVCPEAYDRQSFHGWDFFQITSLVPLAGRRVVDAGAGTGRVALEAAESAAEVWAVEPVERLRRYMRDRAQRLGLENVYAVDGFLHRLPFPDGFADVLVTSHALGWHPDEELAEFERLVRPGGMIMHCPGTVVDGNPSLHERLVSPPWGYDWATYKAPDAKKRKYWKQTRY